MSTFSKSFVRVFGILLLLMMMASVAHDASAAMPAAGQQIGTRATITYEDASGTTYERRSDVVYTKIAQVYQVNVIPMRNPAHAEPGGYADIPFQVTNIGNGTDNVTLSVKGFPSGIDAVTFFSADAGGVPVPGTGIESTKGSSSVFTLNGIKPTNDDQRYFVLRMPVPKSAEKKDEYKVRLNAKTKNGASQDVSANALVIARRPFSVAPSGTARLNEQKRAWVSFRVRGGDAAKKAYFKMWAVNSSDGVTPLPYKVIGDVRFDGNIWKSDDIERDDALVKMVHQVGASGNYLFRMQIEVPSAERGDKMVVFVKYGEADPTEIRPLSENDLEKSTGFVLKFDHIEATPDLTATGNSGSGLSKDYTTIEKAISGETVEYEFSLSNNSTFEDTFTFEDLTEGKGELIARVTPMDWDGQQEILIGASGLPEIGPIPAKSELKFKLRVRLMDGRISSAKQSVPIRVKSLRAITTDPISQSLSINEVVPGEIPIVEFSDVGDMSPLINRLTLSDGEDRVQFYMRIRNTDRTAGVSYQYRMRFVREGFTIRSYSDGSCGSAVTNTGAVDGNGKVFCVDADLTGVSRLESDVIVTDPVSTAQAKAVMAITKLSLMAFASRSYEGSGTPDGDAALTIRVVNRGGDMTSESYELWHDITDASSSTKDWSATFSTDDEKWDSSLSLSEMKNGDSKDVFVKISIPKDAAVNRTWSLTLGLRQIGDETRHATTVVTLSLDESGLLVVKEVAILKSDSPADCANSSLPGNFAKTTMEEVKDGDCIWYRISVTNPPSAPTVHNVSISDPIPKYSSYTAGASTNQSEATPVESAGIIVTDGIDLESDKSLVLTYPVVVDFKK